MIYKLNFLFDRWINNKPYPNLMPLSDLSQGYGDIGSAFPYVVPLRLLYYVEDHAVPYQTYRLQDQLPDVCFYPIGLGFFNFSIDYFELIPQLVLDLVRKNLVTVLFYYHEGDNPVQEKVRLDELCKKHSLSIECYRFVSGNTAARDVSNFVYFADHELFYWRANKKQTALSWNPAPRNCQFTLLSRTHKWWRATVLADLQRRGSLDNSFFSYNLLDVSDQPEDNPIELAWFPGLAESVDKFVAGAPYTCDSLSSQEHNQHHTLVPEHFQESYFNIVLETMFDADQSTGTFLTEKTFKPIKHAQPFVLFAPAGSLATLRELGYRTYDAQISNVYDSITDNTKRYLHAQMTVQSLLSLDLFRWAQQCEEDAVYNQQNFLSSKSDRLNNLTRQLYDSIS